MDTDGREAAPEPETRAKELPAAERRVATENMWLNHAEQLSTLRFL